MAQSQVPRPNPWPKTVSRQLPNRDSGHFGRLFRLQFQVSRGIGSRKLRKSRHNARGIETFIINSLRGGGSGGIRTHDTVARMPVFKTGAFNHSATLPYRSGLRCLRLACGRFSRHPTPLADFPTTPRYHVPIFGPASSGSRTSTSVQDHCLGPLGHSSGLTVTKGAGLILKDVLRGKSRKLFMCTFLVKGKTLECGRGMAKRIA